MSGRAREVREVSVSALAPPGLAAADEKLPSWPPNWWSPGPGHYMPQGAGESRLWTVRRRSAGLRTSLPDTAL
jgi:hypothetical protein